MKRKWFPCFLALALILSLTACGGSAKMDAAAYSSASNGTLSVTEEAFDTVTEAPAETTADVDVLENQKIIYTGQLNLETTDFDDTTKALTGLADSLGGYLQSSTVGGGDRGYRWADYTVRVPSAQFQRFLDQAGGLAHVTWQNTELKNITETYYDTAGRLKTQQIKLERLQALLAQAENMEDIITIESAISETEWSIEELSGALRHYDALVDFATVTVSVQEVYKLSDTEEVPASFGDRLGSAFTRGLSAFGDGLEDFAVSLAYNWTWVLLWSVILAAAVVLLRKAIRRRTMRKNGTINEKSPKAPDDKSDQT